MTTRRGNPTKGAPKYQNRHAFKHNKASKKTKAILSLPNEGLCQRCYEVIEWRKKFRKYKPLTTKKRCSGCGEKEITRAYHNLCVKCAREKGVCAKCRESRDVVKKLLTPEEKKQQQLQQERELAKMSERERRTFFRKLEKDGSDEDEDEDDEDAAKDDEAVKRSGEDDDEDDDEDDEEQEDDEDQGNGDDEEEENEEDGEETKAEEKQHA